MKSFEHIADGENYARTTFILPIREALWAGAFQVETLDGLFDMTPAAQAVPVIDAAVSRFNTAPDELRALLDPSDLVGLRGNRGVLLEMRRKLASLGGTISGAVDESPDPTA